MWQGSPCLPPEGEGTAAFLSDTSGFPISCQAALDPWMLPAFLTLRNSKCGAALPGLRQKRANLHRFKTVSHSGVEMLEREAVERSTEDRRVFSWHRCWGAKIRNQQHSVPHTALLSVVFTAVLPSVVKSVLLKIAQAQARKVNNRLGGTGFHPAACTDSPGFWVCSHLWHCIPEQSQAIHFPTKKPVLPCLEGQLLTSSTPLAFFINIYKTRENFKCQATLPGDYITQIHSKASFDDLVWKIIPSAYMAIMFILFLPHAFSLS